MLMIFQTDSMCASASVKPIRKNTENPGDTELRGSGDTCLHDDLFRDIRYVSYSHTVRPLPTPANPGKRSHADWEVPHLSFWSVYV